MVLSNVSTQIFEGSIDPYDPEYHWGGVSIYPEGPIPTQVEYPGLPAGTTLPPGIPIHLDHFVTPAPPHLAHTPLECPGAPRPDKKPIKSSAAEVTPLGSSSRPKYHSGLYGLHRRLPSSRPTFVYAYQCVEGGRWDHLPESLRPMEQNLRVQAQSLDIASEEACEPEVEVVELRVSHPRYDSSTNRPTGDEKRLNTNRHLNRALQNFRVQFGQMEENGC
ncbi:hypothetical protein RhiTH_005188 [Rhizoctonia solani]